MVRTNRLEKVLTLVIAFIVGIGIGGGGMYFLKYMQENSVIGNKIPFIFHKVKEVGDNWLVKIDGYAISLTEFEESFQLLKSQNPTYAQLPPSEGQKLKVRYFESMIDEYIMALHAINQGILEEKETQILISAAVRSTISSLFLLKNKPEDESFTASEAEIEAFYQEHRKEYDQSGMNYPQIKQHASQMVRYLKSQQWIQSLMSHIKEGFKIERNSKLIKEKGLDSSNLLGGSLPVIPTTPIK